MNKEERKSIQMKTNLASPSSIESPLGLQEQLDALGRLVARLVPGTSPDKFVETMNRISQEYLSDKSGSKKSSESNQ